MLELRTELTDADLRIAWRWIAEESYWGASIPWPLFARACEGSICFGLFESDRLVAFARVGDRRGHRSPGCVMSSSTAGGAVGAWASP